MEREVATIGGRKYARESLGDMLVLGLGVSGKAVVEYLAPLVGSRARSVTVLGGHRNSDVSEWADSVLAAYPGGGIRVVFDEEDAYRALPEGVSRFDICVASPGISMFSDFYESARAASRIVISEVEFAWCESLADSVWVAVTGTNGKTTTTSLIEHLLANSGFDAKAVGNIGDACITQVARDNESRCPDGAGNGSKPACAAQESRGISEAPRSFEARVAVGQGLLPAPSGMRCSQLCYVVECSSYQLASVNRFAPNVAVILGITPDHIKWHRTHEHYAASKFKLLDHLSGVSGAVAVLDATNDEVRAKVREVKAQGEGRGYAYIPIGTKAGVEGDMRRACGSENAAFVGPDGSLEVALGGVSHRLASTSALMILGRHNQLNALAAASAALACGAACEDVSRALTTFAPLEHRIEPSGTVGGVSYYNDSKATNVDATLQALRAFLPKRPVVMLGGDDKGTSLDELVESCAANSKAVVCYGEAGPRFYGAMEPLKGSGIRVELVQTFDEAFDAVSRMARPGDVVLLSPACASFDEFSCFEERGEHFKELVRRLRR